MNPAVLFATVALLVPSDGVNVPPAMLRIDAPATVYAPAIRLDPPKSCDVECVIRDIWPDDLEERALRIAWREPRWQPGVHTSCCFGLFEIHRMHLVWLCLLMDVCTVNDLFDPRLNAAAAYALFERDGWNPWRQ